MNLWRAVRRILGRGWRRINLRFFWQIVLAFVLVTLLTSAGMYWVGRQALEQTGNFVRENPSALQRLWTERLARYYAAAGSWAGVEAMLASYPIGAAWGPWDVGWEQPYVLLTPGGEVVASDVADQAGLQVGNFEHSLGTPIMVDGVEVGRILLAESAPPWRPEKPGRVWLIDLPLPFPVAETLGLSGRIGLIAERLLSTSVYITLIALVVAVILSRGISRPLTEVTKATRAVAGGDLGARVSTEHAGELGELAEAFNHMTEGLARADELRRNLTADVAHELRTPLSVIRGRLEGIIDGVYPAAPEQLIPVLEQTTLLTHLVEDLHLLAQAETGQLRLDLRPTAVGDLLRDAHINFTPQAEDRGVTLVLAVPAALPKVQADWRRIAQVLGNLITNALRYTPEGGTITLTAAVEPDAADSGAITVRVADTGVGIAAEDLPYIFERFWRSDKSRARTEYGGAGLGLAIAKQLVVLHGGAITVESAPGAGATFTFTLPR